MKPEPGVWTVVTHPTNPRRYTLWLDSTQVGTIEAPPPDTLGGWNYVHRTNHGGTASMLAHALASLQCAELDCLAVSAKRARRVRATKKQQEV